MQILNLNMLCYANKTFNDSISKLMQLICGRVNDKIDKYIDLTMMTVMRKLSL